MRALRLRVPLARGGRARRRAPVVVSERRSRAAAHPDRRRDVQDVRAAEGATVAALRHASVAAGGAHRVGVVGTGITNSPPSALCSAATSSRGRAASSQARAAGSERRRSAVRTHSAPPRCKSCSPLSPPPATCATCAATSRDASRRARRRRGGAALRPRRRRPAAAALVRRRPRAPRRAVHGAVPECRRR